MPKALMLSAAVYGNPVLYVDNSDPDFIRVGKDYYLTGSAYGICRSDNESPSAVDRRCGIACPAGRCAGSRRRADLYDDNAAWQAAYDKATSVLDANVRIMPRYDQPIPIEGWRTWHLDGRTRSTGM